MVLLDLVFRRLFLTWEGNQTIGKANKVERFGQFFNWFLSKRDAQRRLYLGVYAPWKNEAENERIIRMRMHKLQFMQSRE